jgi:hypothetical protein
MLAQLIFIISLLLYLSFIMNIQIHKHLSLPQFELMELDLEFINVMCEFLIEHVEVLRKTHVIKIFMSYCSKIQCKKPNTQLML